MNQTKAYESISNYIDGNMSDKELKDFEKILAKDDSLRKEVDEIRLLLKNIKLIKPVKLSSDFNRKLKLAIKSESRKTGYSHKILSIFDHPSIAAMGSVAAALALVIMTTIFFSNQSSDGAPDMKLGYGTESEQAMSDEKEELEKNNYPNDGKWDIEQAGNNGSPN